MAGNQVRVGNVEITSLSDGILEFDLCNFFPNHKSDEGVAVLPAASG